MRLKLLLKFLSTLFGLLCLFSQAIAQPAVNSVLSTGKWLKLGITHSGIYKINAAFLKQNGFNSTQINPQNIRIFGNGAGMLPQALSIARYDDLQENALLVAGESDGRFDNQDYILFYAEGPDQWTFDNNTRIFSHQKNIYSDTSFYFLNIEESPGLRIKTGENLTQNGTVLNSFLDYDFHEIDRYNMLSSGREWYGELFNFINEQNISFPVKGLLSNSKIYLNSSVMARDTRQTSFEIRTNGTLIGQQDIAAVSNDTYDYKGKNRQDFFNFDASLPDNPDLLTLKLTYNQNGGNGTGYLNYLEINYRRKLQLYEQQTRFRAPQSLDYPLVTYVIDQAPSDLIVWEISDPLHPIQQNIVLSGNQAALNAPGSDKLHEFIAFKGNDFESPIALGMISNQNLHALEVPDLVIICPGIFLSEAQRLADFRRNHDGLKVEVVTVQQVYHEFSSGKQDVTAIRDFMKLLFDKNSSKLKYLLLFGDTSYDYKDRLAGNTDFVPIYESRESLHPIYSYSSDDYFGFLEDSDGEWIENTNGDADLEIGIGRLPVKNLQEAQAVVNKLIAYGSNSNAYGSWRNNICFVADDGDGNLHLKDADQLSEQIEQQDRSFNPQKLFLDAFDQIPTANGQIAPEVTAKLNEAVEKGVLIVNYTGHGAEIGWADEKILVIPQIKAWDNINNLPLFVTATCEFGRFDDPKQVSGAEEVLLNAHGGGVGLITTTRPVFSSSNFALNKAFYESVFKPIDGKMPHLGDIMKYTKNNSLSGSVNRNFSLLGDPSMQLAYPKERVVITKINETDPLSDTLNALENVRVQGEIQDNSGTEIQDFEGVLEISVFDKRKTVKTKGSDGDPTTFKDREIILFRGQASIIGGKFDLRFNIPKDIDYTFGAGKISLYARNLDKTLDANGALDQVIIGGTDKSAFQDNQPPEIELFLDNSSFKSGDKVNSDALLIAHLSDDYGINISEQGIGHEINAYLDDQSQAIILNDYFLGDLDTHKSGTVTYPLKGLSPGAHRLSLKVWDIYNNSATKTIDFIVAKEDFIVLENVRLYPNPTSQKCYLSFSHNKTGKSLEMEVEILNSQGKIVRSLRTATPFSESSLEIEWDGLDKQGQAVQTGIYFYRLKVISPEDNTQKQIVKKLLITH